MNRSVLFLIPIVLASCQRSPYAGYKVVADDVHLHLIVLGEGDATPSDNDSVRLRLRMGWQGQGVGELFSTEEMFAVRDLRMGALGPVLRRVHQGDSMSVIAPARSWPWATLAAGTGVQAPDTGYVQVELALIALRTPAMVKAENDRFRRNDPLGYEVKLMKAYRDQSSTAFVQWGTSELHYALKDVVKDSTRVVLGDQVTISYKGKRVEDGQVFDDTKRNGAPFSFRYGDKDQVMEGLEVAVHLLREGQEGVFLFPSSMAFGAKGIPGVLEPYMPVEYTVKLEKVERPAAKR